MYSYRGAILNSFDVNALVTTLLNHNLLRVHIQLKKVQNDLVAY